MSPAKALRFAVEGETYEYTKMYPSFRDAAVAEGRDDAVKEIHEKIAESKEHAEQFKAIFRKTAKQFAALAKVKERHANADQAVLDKLNL